MKNDVEYLLGQLLDYEQPTKYIVESTVYSDSYKIPVLTPGKSFILGYTNEKNGVYKAGKDYPVIIFDDFTTDTKFVDFPFKVKSSAMKILKPNIGVANAKYLFYLMQTIHCEHGTHKRYWLQHYSKISVPVPPLPEQQRIVAKIEELFAELDNSVAILKKVKEQLEVYRQAVLNSAFQNIEKFDAIENLSDFVTSGSRGWAKYYSDDGALFFRIGNLTRDSILINRTNVQHVLLKDNTEGLRTKLVDGDVIISITADIGSIGYVTGLTEDAYVNQHIALVRFKNKNLGKFYAYFLRSEYGQKQLKRNQRGAGKLGLGLDDVRNTHIPVVSEEVSNKTIFEIEFELNKYEKLKNVIDTSLQQADALRQSILQKVFGGEL